MNLSLYLLFVSSPDGQQKTATDQHPVLLAKAGFIPVFDPQQSNRVGSRRLVQASRKPVLIPASRGATVQSIGLGMLVVANALGFLTITGVALLLLRVAEISLF